MEESLLERNLRLNHILLEIRFEVNQVLQINPSGQHLLHEPYIFKVLPPHINGVHRQLNQFSHREPSSVSQQFPVELLECIICRFWFCQPFDIRVQLLGRLLQVFLRPLLKNFLKVLAQRVNHLNFKHLESHWFLEGVQEGLTVLQRHLVSH